jgi:DnaJ homolog subfamily B member 12
MGKPKPKVN